MLLNIFLLKLIKKCCPETERNHESVGRAFCTVHDIIDSISCVQAALYCQFSRIELLYILK